jgi:hypothetical protein
MNDSFYLILAECCEELFPFIQIADNERCRIDYCIAMAA